MIGELVGNRSVNYVLTNLMRLGWLIFCERQDAELEMHGWGLNSMIPNGQSTDRGVNRPLKQI